MLKMEYQHINWNFKHKMKSIHKMRKQRIFLDLKKQMYNYNYIDILAKNKIIGISTKDNS